MKNVLVLLFTAGWIGCSAAPVADEQVALRGRRPVLDQPVGATRCECIFACAATGQEFFGLSTSGAQVACAKARSQCTQSACTTCTQTGLACE